MGESGAVSGKFENLILSNVADINRILSAEQSHLKVDALPQVNGMGPMVGAVCSLRSGMAQKPSEPDSLRVQVALEKVRILKNQALHQKNMSSSQEDEYAALKAEMLESEGVLYQCKEAYEGISQKLLPEIEGLKQRISGYREMEEAHCREINELEKRIRAAQEKKERASQWWWYLIPGYNIYVALDATLDSDVHNLEHLKSNAKNIQQEKAVLEQQLSDLQRKLESDNSELGACNKEWLKLEQDIVDVCGRITDCGKEIQKWNSLFVMYSEMESDIEINGIKSQYMLQEVRL